MSTEPHQPPEDHDDPLATNDPIWDTLGKAPLREPDGWFAARTLARVRTEQASPVKTPAAAGWLRWLWAPAAAMALLFAGLWIGGAPSPTAIAVVEPVTAPAVAEPSDDLHEAFTYLANSDDGTEEEIWLVTTL